MLFHVIFSIYDINFFTVMRRIISDASFLDASTHHYEKVCPSVVPWGGPSCVFSNARKTCFRLSRGRGRKGGREGKKGEAESKGESDKGGGYGRI